MDLKILAIGWVLGMISRRIVAAWLKYRGQIKTELREAEKKIEEKTGIEIPDRWVESAVAFADRYASDGAFWRNVIRMIVNKDASKANALLDEIRRIDWKAYLVDQLSPDLKEIVNTEKRAVAVSILSNRVESIKAAKTGDIGGAVDKAAAADKSERMDKAIPVNETVIERLIRESQERKAELRAHSSEPPAAPK